MARKRRNPPPTESRRRSREGGEISAGERVRRRLAASPEIDLSDEDIDALADEGLDPEEVRRIARERIAAGDKAVSPHDMDTPRDDLEGLTFEEDYE